MRLNRKKEHAGIRGFANLIYKIKIDFIQSYIQKKILTQIQFYFNTNHGIYWVYFEPKNVIIIYHFFTLPYYAYNIKS